MDLKLLLSANNLRYKFPKLTSRDRSLKLSFSRLFSQKSVVDDEDAWDIGPIDLDLHPGDRLGVIGPNGAGKTTLLRLLGRLIPPSEGRVDHFASVTTIINRGIGLDDFLTGRENVELPMRMLGAQDTNIVDALANLEALTGLNDALDDPYYTYSEGMKARLVFAICVSVNSDVLILDEWLAAGDVEFSQRAERIMFDRAERAEALILSSHSMELIERVCNKCIYIQNGRVEYFGAANTCVEKYLKDYHVARLGNV